jgi:hypothetical protein
MASFTVIVTTLESEPLSSIDIASRTLESRNNTRLPLLSLDDVHHWQLKEPKIS